MAPAEVEQNVGAGQEGAEFKAEARAEGQLVIKICLMITDQEVKISLEPTVPVPLNRQASQMRYPEHHQKNKATTTVNADSFCWSAIGANKGFRQHLCYRNPSLCTHPPGRRSQEQNNSRTGNVVGWILGGFGAGTN